MSDQISLVGLNKAKVLAALYNASHPQGMGFMHYDPAPMEETEASGLLSERTYFDYLKGRVMKVDLSSDSLEPFGYDRDNGQGAAQRVIDALRRGEPEDGLTASQMHSTGKAEAIQNAREGLHEGITTEDKGDVRVVTMGLADVAETLGPMIDKAES